MVILTVHASLVITLEIILIIADFIYLLKRVLKIKQRNFHLMMFSIILISCSSLICNYLVSSKNKTQYKLTYWWDIYYFGNVLAHSIFSMKYWIIAKKMKIMN